MSAFVDGLTRGTWYLEAAGAGYLAPSSQADPAGNPYLMAVARRGAATKFSFTIVSSGSPTSVVAKLTEVGTGRRIAVNGEGALVFAPATSAGESFAVAQQRPSIFTLQTAVPKSVVYAAAHLRFEATGGAPPTPMQLAIDPQAGSLLWRRQLGSTALGAPAIFEGAQVVSGKNPFMTCVEGPTGRILWECEENVAATSPPVVSWAARAAVAAAGATVYAVSMDNASVIWKFTASSSVYARPRATANQVFVCASYGVLHALSAADGSELWRYPASGTLEGLYATAAMAAGTLFVGAWDGSLHAVDAATGHKLWSYTSGDKINAAALATESSVYFGNDAGAVIALDRKSGALKWTTTVDGIVQARPALCDGLLLVASATGTLYALDAQTGNQVWSPNLGAPISSDVAVADGIAYLTTTTGLLYALQVTPPGPPSPSSVSLGGPSAGTVNVFSGTVNASTLGGATVSSSCGLRSDLHPIDQTTPLQASQLANSLVSGQAAPAVPPNWALTGTAFASNSLAYATALVATLARPSDDLPIVLVAFGAQPVPLLNFYDPTVAMLKDLPASIAGPNAPSGVQVTDTVLDNYASMRSALLTLIGGTGAKNLMVTGHGQGGALAMLAAVDYATLKSDTPTPASLRCLSFGAPPVGNAAFASLCRSAGPLGSFSLFRMLIEGDPIVDSLGAGWQHVGVPVTLGQGFAAPVEPSSVASYARAMTGRL